MTAPLNIWKLDAYVRVKPVTLYRKHESYRQTIFSAILGACKFTCLPMYWIDVAVMSHNAGGKNTNGENFG